MYAVVGKWRMDPAQREEQDRILNDQIVPMVKQAPGFVSGYWGRAADGVQAVSFVVFEDQAAADGFAATVESDPEDRARAGVEAGWLTITEIVAVA
jgi:hypothetical protein